MRKRHDQCEATGSPVSNMEHRGHVSATHVEIMIQPPGHGSFTIKTTVELCDRHRRWFKDGQANIKVKKARRDVP